MTFLPFIILALAVYRITHLIVFDKIFEPIRKHFVTRGFDGTNLTFTLQGGAVRRFVGKIMNCYWCAGIWVSAAVMTSFYFYQPLIWFYAVWALAGFAALLETAWVKVVGLPSEMVEVKAELEDDPLSAAHGIKNGVIISVFLWAALIGGALAVRHFFG